MSKFVPLHRNSVFIWNVSLYKMTLVQTKDELWCGWTEYMVDRIGDCKPTTNREEAEATLIGFAETHAFRKLKDLQQAAELAQKTWDSLKGQL